MTMSREVLKYNFHLPTVHNICSIYKTLMTDSNTQIYMMCFLEGVGLCMLLVIFFLASRKAMIKLDMDMVPEIITMAKRTMWPCHTIASENFKMQKIQMTNEIKNITRSVITAANASSSIVDTVL